MPDLPNTAFLPRVWNNRNDDLQNLAGVFGSLSGSRFTPEACPAGLLCSRSGSTTGGTARFVAGTSAEELWVCNPSDVQRISDGHENLYALGCRTLGLALPAGRIGTFTRLKQGEVYAFGSGNFSATPDSDYPYVIPGSGGQLTVSEDKPASGFYFVLDPTLGTDCWTEGSDSTQRRFNLLCCKA